MGFRGTVFFKDSRNSERYTGLDWLDNGKTLVNFANGVLYEPGTVCARGTTGTPYGGRRINATSNGRSDTV